MTLPKATTEAIKAEAERYAGLMIWVNQSIEPDGPMFHEYISVTSYQAGATEWAGRAEGILIPALELIQKKLTGINDTITNDILAIATNALAKYKEVSNG